MDMRREEAATRKSIEVCCCYAHKDESFLLDFQTHLVALQRHGFINIWTDMDIRGGATWKEEIHHHLNTARIILLLVSPDFIADDERYLLEMPQAMERQARGEAQVIPILLRPTTDWKNTPFGHLRPLPTNAKPVISWNRPDEAYMKITQEIQKVVKDLWDKDERLEIEEAKLTRLAEEKRRHKAEEALAQPISETPLFSGSSPAALPQSRHRLQRRVLLLLIAVVLIIASGIGLSTSIIHQITTSHAQSTAATNVHFNASNTTTTGPATVDVQATFTVSALETKTAMQQANLYGGTLIASDPMNGPGSAFSWSIGNDRSGNKCNFENGGYHVSGECDAKGGIFPPKFAFEVTLATGQSCGSIEAFADNANSLIGVCQDGDYILYGSSYSSRQKGSASSMHTDTGQSNIIGMVVDGTNVILYINHVMVASVSNSSGTIRKFTFWGEDSDAALLNNNNPSVSDNREVVYTNAFLWAL